MMLKISFLLLVTINIFAYTKTTDTKNLYFESEHFRTVAGKSYSESSVLENFSDKLLDAAEQSWETEIENLKFKKPKNTDTKKIDIYIGNRSSFNYETQSYEIISSSYAGWATSYPSDDTPYFLINPELTNEQLKVTISHEFFHTIQYTYFDEKSLSNDKWFRNIWWLEATAVLMEDEVYDEINDYINFLSPFFDASYKNFEIYNGSHEYSMVIFAKYIREKYGIKIIKDTFSLIDKSENDGYFEILNSLLINDYNSSMPLALNEFAKWVLDSNKYFVDGRLYPTLKHYKNNDNILIEKGGIKIIDNLISGWNMVTLTNDNITNLDISNLDVIWSYKNGIWKNSINKEIKDCNSSMGYWVKTNAISSLNYTYFDTSTNNILNIDNNWSLLGTTRKIDLSSLDTQPILIWQYNDNKWFVYSNDATLFRKLEELNYPILETILPYSSYWIKKISSYQ